MDYYFSCACGSWESQQFVSYDSAYAAVAEGKVSLGCCKAEGLFIHSEEMGY